MRRFRASYSVLSKWATGMPEYQEEAMRMYFKMPSETVAYIKEGQDLHKAWEEEARSTGHTPKVFGGRKLHNQHVLELKVEVPVNDWLEIVGVLDRLEYVPEIGGWEVLDYKSGDGGKGFYKRIMRSSDVMPTALGVEITYDPDYLLVGTGIPVSHQTSTTHLSKPQLGIYAALANYWLKNRGYEMEVKRVQIQHLNQTTGKIDSAYRWVDKKMQEEAIDWVITYASEMHSYLEEYGVYKDPWKFLGITQEQE